MLSSCHHSHLPVICSRELVARGMSHSGKTPAAEAGERAWRGHTGSNPMALLSVKLAEVISAGRLLAKRVCAVQGSQVLRRRHMYLDTEGLWVICMGQFRRLSLDSV